MTDPTKPPALPLGQHMDAQLRLELAQDDIGQRIAELSAALARARGDAAEEARIIAERAALQRQRRAL